MKGTGKTILQLAREETLQAIIRGEIAECYHTRKEFERFTQLSKENQELLMNCEGGHDFSIVLRNFENSHVVGYECTKCGGEVDTQTKRWYELGFKHGREREETNEKKVN